MHGYLLCSESITHPLVVRYCNSMIQSADPNSIFAQVKPSTKPRDLISAGYDGILLIKEKSIIGNLFWQSKDGIPHFFAIFIEESRRRQGYAKKMLQYALIRTNAKIFHFENPISPKESAQAICRSLGIERNADQYLINPWATQKV